MFLALQQEFDLISDNLKVTRYANVVSAVQVGSFSF